MLLSQLLIRPKCLMNFNTRTRIVGFRHYTNNIVAKRRVRYAEHAPVDTRGARNLPALAAIDVRLGRGNVVSSTRLDLDKTQRRTVICDHVDLGVDDDVAPVSADGQTEIRSNDAITLLFKMFDGQRFATRSQREVPGRLSFAIMNSC